MSLSCNSTSNYGRNITSQKAILRLNQTKKPLLRSEMYKTSQLPE